MTMGCRLCGMMIECPVGISKSSPGGAVVVRATPTPGFHDKDPHKARRGLPCTR